MKAQTVTQEDFSSRDRRERPFEIRLEEEKEYLKNSGLTDFLIFKLIPNNPKVNPKLYSASKKKTKGAYSPIAPTVKVVRIYETSTTIDYLMRLTSRGGELAFYDISQRAEKDAGADERIRQILAWVANEGRIQTISKASDNNLALEEKLRAKLEKQIRAQIEKEIANVEK